METRSILIVSSFKIVLKVLPSKHLTLHKQKLSHKVEKSRKDIKQGTLRGMIQDIGLDK